MDCFELYPLDCHALTVREKPGEIAEQPARMNVGRP
jgi:hypothetical protein